MCVFVFAVVFSCRVGCAVRAVKILGVRVCLGLVGFGLVFFWYLATCSVVVFRGLSFDPIPFHPKRGLPIRAPRPRPRPFA